MREREREALDEAGVELKEGVADVSVIPDRADRDLKIGLIWKKSLRHTEENFALSSALQSQNVTLITLKIYGSFSPK